MKIKAPAIMKNAGSLLSKAGLQLRKSSPEILVVVGIAGVVVSTVMACKATRKAEKVLDETKETLDDIHEQAVEKEEESDGKKLVATYAKTGLKLARVYAPAAAIGVLSVGCILTSHRILNKRNVALAAAYTTIDTSFKEYRNRVAARFGEEVENEIRNNIKTVDVVETTVDEKGKEAIVERTAKVIDPTDSCSDYAKVFDRSNKLWESVMDYNLLFLNQVQATANDRLRANGFLFLNDVYDDLAFDHTIAGQFVGWRYDTKHPTGDNLVDIKRTIVEVRNEFGGYDKAIVLDFNVDGDILHKINLKEI